MEIFACAVEVRSTLQIDNCESSFPCFTGSYCVCSSVPVNYYHFQHLVTVKKGMVAFHSGP